MWAFLPSLPRITLPVTAIKHSRSLAGCWPTGFPFLPSPRRHVAYQACHPQTLPAHTTLPSVRQAFPSGSALLPPPPSFPYRITPRLGSTAATHHTDPPSVPGRQFVYISLHTPSFFFRRACLSHLAASHTPASVSQHHPTAQATSIPLAATHTHNGWILHAVPRE